tara:strand:+ start:17563 stop:18123 length:561 start_codon:yes stop_codon:yes gene_type:complete
MRIVAIITSRWESTRLLGKALIDICGKPMLRRIVDAAYQSTYICEVVVATTPSSEPIIQYCQDNLIPFYIGDEEDILGRIYGAAKQSEADIVVRLWGDAPLVESTQIDAVVEYALSIEDNDYYASLSTKYGVVSIVPFEVLEKLNKELHDHEARHWIHKSLDEAKATVDTQEDLDEVCELWAISER